MSPAKKKSSTTPKKASSSTTATTTAKAAKATTAKKKRGAAATASKEEGPPRKKRGRKPKTVPKQQQPEEDGDNNETNDESVAVAAPTATSAQPDAIASEAVVVAATSTVEGGGGGEVVTKGTTTTTANNKKKGTTTTTTTNKRKRASPTTSRKIKTTTTTSSSKKAGTKGSNQQQPEPIPSTTLSSAVVVLKTLLIDNGGHCLKYGWANTSNDADDNNNTEQQQQQPHSMPNQTARLPQQWTVLAGDDLLQHHPNQWIHVTASTERGIITNLGNQMHVWKRVLDKLRVSIPLDTETAQTFGWALQHKKQQQQQQQNAAATTTTTTIRSNQCAVVLTVPPYCPRTVLDHIAYCWLEDFGFARVGFCNAATMASRHYHCSSRPCTTVVDLGWSATTVVPTIRGEVVPRPAPAGSVIRRLPLGGRHMINIWKYYTSYRQWNLMDATWILQSVWEQAAYCSLNFEADMAIARQLPPGRRPFDREFVLPDFVTTMVGKVQLPPALLLQQQQQEQEEEADEDDMDDDDDEDDEDVREEDMNEEDIELDLDGKHDDVMPVDDAPVEETTVTKKQQNIKSNKKTASSSSKKKTGKAKAGRRRRSKKTDENKMDQQHDDDDEEEEEEGSEDDDEDEEDIEAIKARLLQERAAEAARQRELEASQQKLHLCTERFAIPEMLFRPRDGGFPKEWAGLAQTIHLAIQACPAIYQPALYRSIVLVGGVAQLPNLVERLQRELRALVPDDFTVVVELAQANPKGETTNSGIESMTATKSTTGTIFAVWRGMQDWVQSAASPTIYSFSREEWEQASRRGAWKPLSVTYGDENGLLI